MKLFKTTPDRATKFPFDQRTLLFSLKNVNNTISICQDIVRSAYDRTNQGENDTTAGH